MFAQKRIQGTRWPQICLLAWLAACATQQQGGQNQDESNLNSEQGGQRNNSAGQDNFDNANVNGGDNLTDDGDGNGGQDGEEFDLAGDKAGDLPYINEKDLAGGGGKGGNNFFGNGAGNGSNNVFGNPPANDSSNPVNAGADAPAEFVNNAPVGEDEPINVPPANNVQQPVANNAPVNAAPTANAASNNSNSSPQFVDSAASNSAVQTADVNAVYAKLRWVGYSYDKEKKHVVVELLTHGNPQYDFFQELNQAKQPELIVRFYETDARTKLRRPLDASEFRSPVAYVRIRDNVEQHYVDVIITLRDHVQPKMFAKDGDVILTFDIPEYYFGKEPQEVKQIIEQAKPLASAEIVPLLIEGSETPRVMNQGDPARSLRNESEQNGGQAVPVKEALPPAEDGAAPANVPGVDTRKPENIPQGELIDFDSTEQEPAEADVLALFTRQSVSVFGVAQDNLEQQQGNIQNATGNGNQANNGGNSGNGGNNANNANTGSNKNNGGNNFNNLGNNLNNGGNANVGNGGNVGLNNAGGGLNAPGGAGLPPNPALDNSSLNINPAANNASLQTNPGGPVNPINTGTNNQAINTGVINSAPNVSNNVPVTNDANIETVSPESAEAVGQDQEGAPAAPGTKGRAVTLDFHKAPINLVLKTFSEESGNNFIYPNEVADTEITIRMKNVPWDEALKAILETYGLGMVQVGPNVVRIDRLAKMNEYLKDLNTVRQYRDQLEKTKLLVMRLSHGQAKNIITQMQELLKEDIAKDPRVKVTADERTNSIVAEASPVILTKIKDVVERLDLETPQVRIVSRIVEVAKTANNFLGVLWSNALNFDPSRGLGFGALPFPNSVTSDFTVDPGVSTQNTAGNLSMRFGSLNRFLDLDLLLKMEERKGTTNILQSNTLLVMDREPARIIAGSSQFFRPAAGGNVINSGSGAGGGGGSGLSEVTFNLSLDVVPQVTANGNINIKLVITSDTPGDVAGEALANKNTRRLETTMARRSGETAVIGGIYDTKRSKTVVGIPYLSDLPLIGVLFRSTNVQDSQTEMLIMVTPTLVNANDSGAAQDPGVPEGSLGPSALPPPTPGPNVSLNGGNNVFENGATQGFNNQVGNNNINPDAINNVDQPDANNGNDETL